MATDPFDDYRHLANTPGANSYGVPRHKWAKMTKRQKAAFRNRVYRARMRETEEGRARLREIKTRSYNRSPEAAAAKREYSRAWNSANIERKRVSDRAYMRRKYSRLKTIANPEQIFRQIVRAIPAMWPRHMRDDIAGMIYLDILENRAELRNLPMLVKTAATKFNRIMETWKTTSLDAPIAGTDGLTRLDILAAPEPDDSDISPEVSYG